MTERIVALIPARGGSKRLPRKNVMSFLGKPIIHYTIEAALQTRLFARVVTSSEDAHILEVAAAAGASLHRRPHALATDTASVVEVCRDFLQSEQAQGRHYDILCVLYATAPLRTADDIKAVVALVRDGKADRALAVTSYSQPAHQALKVAGGGILEPMWPELVNLNGRDIPQLCVDNGSTYAVRTGSFMETGTFYGPGLRGHLMPAARSVDIDTRDDFDLALYYAKRNMS